MDYYYIDITDNTTSTMNQFNNFTFELKGVYPNPINDQSKIQFITGEPKDVVFSVFNYLGEKMDEQIIAANRGVNDIFINANNYHEVPSFKALEYKKEQTILDFSGTYFFHSGPAHPLNSIEKTPLGKS